MSFPFGDTAPSYYVAGLQVIPLRASQKIPIPKAWQSYARLPVPADTQKLWTDKYRVGNIGLVLGPASGVCMIDIDTDDPALLTLIREKLPASPWERRGKKGCALAYRYSGHKTFRIKDASGKMIVECLSSGAQLVLPPSIHPDTKKAYEADTDLFDPGVLAGLVGLPADIEAVLRAALTAAGVMLTVAGSKVAVPTTGPIAAGSRDVVAVAEAGRLSRGVLAGRLTLWEAVSAMQAFCIRFEGPDKPDTAKFVDKLIEFLLLDSVVKIKGKPVLEAVPGMFDAGGEPVYEEVRMLPYGWDEGSSYAELKQWGLDRIKTGYGERYIARWYVLIARTGQLVDTRTNELLSMAVVLNREVGSYVAYHSQTRKKEDTVKDCRALRRVEYAKLLPAKPRGIVSEPPYQVWNTWQGFAAHPIAGVTDADIEPILRLVRLMVPDARERKHLWDWIAHLIQYPGVKMMHAVLIISEAQGIGKGTLAGCICDLMHKNHRAIITVEDLCSDFNAHWLPGRVFGFADELQSVDRRDVTNRLKTLVTGETVIVNQKNIPAYEAPNTINFMLASNKPDALYLDQQDRRFFIIRIGDAAAERIQREFDFAAFRPWWANPISQGRLLGGLMARDLSGFNPKGHAPMTAGKEALLDLTKSRWEAVLQDALEAGLGPFSKGVVTVDGLVAFLADHRQDKSSAHVREWCKRAGLVSVMHRVRVPRRGDGVGTVKATVWAVRDAEHWRTAGRDAVLAELARSAPFETRAMQAEREAGPHTSKKGESMCPEAQAGKELAPRMGSGTALAEAEAQACPSMCPGQARQMPKMPNQRDAKLR